MFTECPLRDCPFLMRCADYWQQLVVAWQSLDDVEQYQLASALQVLVLGTLVLFLYLVCLFRKSKIRKLRAELEECEAEIVELEEELDEAEIAPTVVVAPPANEEAIASLKELAVNSQDQFSMFARYVMTLLIKDRRGLTEQPRETLHSLSQPDDSDEDE